jgi:hypothetical protein
MRGAVHPLVHTYSWPCAAPNTGVNYTLNFKVEQLAFLLRTREVSGSNLDAGDRPFSLRFFVVFVSPSRKMREQCFKLGHDRFLPHPYNSFIL